LHKLPLLEWDLALSNGAQMFADDCNFKHSTDAFRTQQFVKFSGKVVTNSKMARFGENLIADAETGDGEQVNVDALFTYATQWNCEEDTCDSRPGEKPKCGSIRQVLNEKTTRVGCGFKLCQVNSPFGQRAPNWNLLVCWYNPAVMPSSRPFPAEKCPAPTTDEQEGMDLKKKK
jgi:hypothetical protein